MTSNAVRYPLGHFHYAEGGWGTTFTKTKERNATLEC